jgi:hypothetical protein
MALAHVSGDRVRDAYQRGELMQKRGELMDAWAAYCGPSEQPQKGTGRKRHPLQKPDAAGQSRSRRSLSIPEPIPHEVAGEIR